MVTQASGGPRRPWGRVAVLVLGAVGLLVAAGAAPGRQAPVPVAVMADVMVSARPLAESTTLAAGDVRLIRVPASTVTAALSGNVGSVLGRRLLVSLAAGTPLIPAMMGMPSDGHPAQRLIPLNVSADHLAPQLAAGTEVDVVAADPAPGAGPGGRVEVVGWGRLVALGSRVEAASADPNGGSDRVLLLACDEGVAMRLLWAQAFAHSLTVVARPEGSRPLPSTGGPDA